MNTHLLNSAIHSLSRRAYHSEELRKKLLQKGATDEEVTKVIEKLFSYRYLNDKAYVENFIQMELLRKTQGIRLIRQKLRQKGIPLDQITPVFTQYEATELDRAVQALEKKKKTLKAASTLQQKQKLARFLAARGFRMDVIARALREHCA